MMNRKFTSTNATAKYWETSVSEIARIVSNSDHWDITDGHFLICGNNRNQINIFVSTLDEYRGLGTQTGKITLTGRFNEELSEKVSESFEGAAFTDGFYLVKVEKKIRPVFIHRNYGDHLRVFVLEQPVSKADRFRWTALPVVDITGIELLDKIEKLEKLAEKLLEKKEKAEANNAKANKAK